MERAVRLVQRADVGDFHHGEAVVMIALVVLALSPSGRALSIDSLWRDLRAARRRRRFERVALLREESAFARWPLRLVAWVFALIYLSAAIFKLEEAGLDWVNGYPIFPHCDPLSRSLTALEHRRWPRSCVSLEASPIARVAGRSGRCAAETPVTESSLACFWRFLPPAEKQSVGKYMSSISLFVISSFARGVANAALT